MRHAGLERRLEIGERPSGRTPARRRRGRSTRRAGGCRSAGGCGARASTIGSAASAGSPVAAVFRLGCRRAAVMSWCFPRRPRRESARRCRLRSRSPKNDRRMGSGSSETDRQTSSPRARIRAPNGWARRPTPGPRSVLASRTAIRSRAPSSGAYNCARSRRDHASVRRQPPPPTRPTRIAPGSTSRSRPSARDDGRPYAVLDDTVLYPEGGGQPADRGRLGAVAVVDVQRVEGEIRHFLEAPVELGAAVLELDWRRRHDHMQQHTAQHLLSALALERFGWATRSFHLGAETSDIELDAAGAVRRAISRRSRTRRRPRSPPAGRSPRAGSRPRSTPSLDVRSRGLPAGHTGDIRLVEIEGVDLNTCGGTHLRSTAEIEAVKLLRAEPLRGGCRAPLGRRPAAAPPPGRARDAHRPAARPVRQRRRQPGRDRRAQARAAGRRPAADPPPGEPAGRGRRRRPGGRAAKPVMSAHFDDADGGFLQQVGRALRRARPGRRLPAHRQQREGALLPASPPATTARWTPAGSAPGSPTCWTAGAAAPAPSFRARPARSSAATRRRRCWPASWDASPTFSPTLDCADVCT